MAGGSKRTPPKFWILFMVGGWQWEWWTRPVIQAEGLKKGSHEEDERGWITHERGGSFWRRSQIWAQSE